MSEKALAMLAAVVLALAGFIWFFERDRASTDEREAQSRMLLRVDPDEVAGVDLVSVDREISFERGSRLRAGEEIRQDAAQDEESGVTTRDRWRLTSPLQGPADHFAVDGLVRSLAELEKSRTLDDFLAQDVGLEPPRATVTLHFAEGESVLVEVGAEVPASSQMVVRVVGRGEAHVVSSSLWASLEKDVGDWRSKEVFDGTREDIRTVRLSRDGGSVLLEQRESGFWVVEPFEDRADSDKVDSLLREITGMRVTDFLDPSAALSELGLDPPRARVEVSGYGIDGFSVAWGDQTAAGGANNARVDDLVFTTVANLDEALTHESEAWRSKKLSAFPVYQVDVVEIEEAGELLELTRDEGSWLRGDDRIDFAAVSDLLYQISEAVAERLVPAPPAAELGMARLVIRYRSSSGASERLEIFEETSAGLTPALVEGRPMLLLLPSGVRKEIEGRLMAVREAEAVADELEQG